MFMQLSSVTGWMKKALEVLKESTDTETLYYATLAAVNLRTLTEGDGGMVWGVSTTG